MVRGAAISWKALLAVIFWGLSFICTKQALSWLSPALLVASRMVIGTLTLAVLARLANQHGRLARQDRPRCVLLGVVLGVHLFIQSLGLGRTTATNTAWIIGFIPIVIALASWLFLRDRIALRAWLGIALGALGVALVVLVDPQTGGFTDLHLSEAKWGDLLAVASCFTWTAYTLLALGPIQRNGSRLITQWTIGVAAIAMAPVAALSETIVGPAAPTAVLAVLFLGIFCSGAAFWLWYAAIRDIGSTATGAYIYLEPVVTWVAAWALLGERIRLLALAGGFAVLLGVWLVAASKKQISHDEIAAALND